MLHHALLAFLLAAPTASAQDLDALRRELASSDASARQQAVRSLAELARPEAWELVLSALDDPDARVADEAELRLAAIDAAGLALLLGEGGIAARDAQVAVRAAEAVGRVGFAVNQSKLTSFLELEDDDAREMVLWSLERLARAGRLSGDLSGDPWRRVERVHRRDSSVRHRAQALQTLVAFAPEKAADAIRDAAQSEEPELRCSAVAAALTLPKPGPGAMYLELANDPAPSVRRAVVEVLASLRDRIGAVALVDRLETESDERLTWTIVEHLRELSGLAHGRDARAWRAWSAALPADWAPGQAAPPTELGDATVAFAGLPVLSRRVVFLIDMSGSMWEARADGRTRKQAVDVELRRLLESLPADTEFNVIPYTDAPMPWQAELVSATRGNVKAALEDFERENARGKGAFWEAWLLAIEDPRVDTVMVLTDGAPTGGRLWNLELLSARLQQRNRFRGVVLDAVLFGARGRIVELWTGMCAGTGGRCRVTEL